MKIEIKQEHIDKGVPGHSCACPVALAMIDAGFINPTVGAYFIMWDAVYPSRILVSTPTVVELFIEAFDNLWPMKPTTFDLHVE